MVNSSIAIRRRLLEQLRTAPKPVNGDSLGEALGVSRVAIWKHFQALRKVGYDLESSRAGYRLGSEGDFLLPWEFPGREDRVIHLTNIRSTMDHAREIALTAPRSGAVVVAERQSAGRGRGGQRWSSSAGGLFFTLVLAPLLAPERCWRVVLAGAVVLCRTLRDLTGERFLVEWPNDIYLEGRKVAGLLAEYLVEGDALRFVDLGVGVNVANRSPGPSAISLLDIGGRHGHPSRRLVLESFLDRFEAVDLHDKTLHEQWMELSGSLGRPVRALQSGTLLGRAAGIEDDGRLVVELAGGGRKTCWPSEAHLQGKEKRP